MNGRLIRLSFKLRPLRMTKKTKTGSMKPALVDGLVHWKLDERSQLQSSTPCTRLLYAEHVKYDERIDARHTGLA